MDFNGEDESLSSLVEGIVVNELPMPSSDDESTRPAPIRRTSKLRNNDLKFPACRRIRLVAYSFRRREQRVAAGRPSEAQMPFSSIGRDGVLTSTDLDVLQEIYDAAAVDVSSVDDATMHDVARTLLMYYRAGERDREKLIGMALRDLQRAIG